MATVVGIVNGRGLGIDTRHSRYSVRRYFNIIVVKSSCTCVKIQGTSVIKVGVVYVNIRLSRHLKECWLGLKINGFRLSSTIQS